MIKAGTLGLGILTLFLLTSDLGYKKPVDEIVLTSTSNTTATLWEYQCIDTMKTSRDKARIWMGDPTVDKKIEAEMQAIVDLGGNCIAIATPYDDEFLPLLQKWVTSARKHNLKIWFRGNFSSWEGWFDYPKGMTTNQHHQKTTHFITFNPNLFKDGDVFTPSPEAENGGPFNQVEIDEHAGFRKYLIEEHDVAKSAFAKIGKKVIVNWMSMNGGLAKRMFDQPTVDKLGKTVAIDHYIKTDPEMGEFIQYFNQKYGAKLVIGEFGAPIPEINGSMSEDQQAEFIDKLLNQIYQYKNVVTGLSYWTLTDGSTALYNPDMRPRKAVQSVKKYFKPAQITGVVTDVGDKPLKSVRVTTSDNVNQITTDQNGYFKVVVPIQEVSINIQAQNYHLQILKISPESHKSYHYDIKLRQIRGIPFIDLDQILKKI